MITQQTLKEIRANLDKSFSTFSTRYSVQRFVKDEMRRLYTTSAFYTDERCSVVYKRAINVLEKAINDEYNRIVKQIKEYIDDLNGSIAINDKYVPYDNDSFKRLAIGAGAGLGAAVLLGGPIGWMVGIGAGIAALYNSNKKESDLIDSILDEANKLNGETIEKIKNILDLYIVEDEILSIPNVDYILSEDPINKALTPKQLEIKNFLEERGIKYLVHFTDEANICSIKTHGILSKKEGKRRGVHINVNDNGLSAHKADKFMQSTSDDYISLTVTAANEKVLSSFKSRRSIKNVKRIFIDARILWKEINTDRIYCNMNASAKSLICGNDIEALKSMFAPVVKQTRASGEIIYEYRYEKANNIPTHCQAEILFQSFIDPKYFIDI